MAAFALADRLKIDIEDILDWPLPKFHAWLAYCELYAEHLETRRG